MALAVAFGIAAAAWGLDRAAHSPLNLALGNGELAWRMVPAAAAWAVGLAALVLWWRGRLGPGILLVLTAVELSLLYYAGPNSWGWPTHLPQASPALSRLAREPGVRLVAGRLDDLPVLAGLTTAFPYLGIVPPPPNYLLEMSTRPGWTRDPDAVAWLKRFGVTHGVWSEPIPPSGAVVLFAGPDRALDRLIPATAGPEPATCAWCATPGRSRRPAPPSTPACRRTGTVSFTSSRGWRR